MRRPGAYDAGTVLPDYHMHTRLCQHAAGEPKDYAARAIEAGLPEICLTDHMPMPAWYDPMSRMRPEEFPTYEGWASEARRLHPSLPIRFGVEGDFHPDAMDHVAGFLGSRPFDYVIGSVHVLGDWGFDNEAQIAEWSRRDVLDVWEDYFHLVELMAESRLFDSLGHPDLPKKFGRRPDADLEPLFREVLACVKENGLCLEVNTSGLRKPCREIYPARRLLEIAADLGVPIVTGSDAHEPGSVGANFAEALALLRETGHREASRFERRKRIPVPLPSSSLTPGPSPPRGEGKPE